MAIKELKVKLNLDFSEFNKGFDKALNKISSASASIGKNMTSLGTKLSIGLSAPLTLIGKNFLDLAIKAEDAGDKFNAIFDKSAPKVSESLKSISDELGRSQTDLLNYSANLGSMLQSMGFASSEAGDLSVKLVQLGIDVGSLRGVADGTVMDIFTNSLTGATKGLKELGIYVNENDIKLEALHLGLTDGEGDLTDFAKASAVASLLQKNFAKDTGDAKKSVDDFSEILTRMKTRFTELGEELGAKLKPDLIWLEDKTKTLKEWFDRLSDTSKTWIVNLGLIGIVLPPIILGFGLMATAISSIINFATIALGLLGTIKLAIIALTSAIWSFVAATASIAWTALVSGATLAGEAFVFFSTTILPIVVIIASIVQIVRMAIQAFSFFAGIIADNAEAIVKYLGPALLILLKSMERVINTTVFLSNIGKGFEEASKMAMEATMSINSSIGELQKELDNPNKYHGISDGIKEQAMKAEMYLVNMGESLDQKLADIPRNIADVTQLAFSKIKEFASDAWGKIGRGFGGMVGFFTGKWDSMIEAMKRKMEELLIKFGVINPAKETPKTKPPEKENPYPVYNPGPQMDHPDDVLGDPNVYQQHFEKVKTLWDDFAEHVGTIANTVKETMFGLYDSIASGFGDAINSMIFDGVKFADVMKKLGVDIIKEIIKALVKLGVQYVTTAIIGATTSKAVAISEITNSGARALAGGTASMAGAPFPLNLTAPAFGAAMEGLALSALAEVVALKDGGITQGPTNALIGEAGQEAVIPLNKLDSITGTKEQTIMINLDGREITRAVIKNMPREIRLNTGVSF